MDDTTTTILPAAAADCLARQLYERGMKSAAYKLEISRDLSRLTVAELKRVWALLSSHHLTTPIRKPASQAVKPVWIRTVQRCFFVDANCTSLNTAILDSLNSDSERASPSSAPPAPGMPQLYPPPPPQQPSQAQAPHATRPLPATDPALDPLLEAFAATRRATTTATASSTSLAPQQGSSLRQGAESIPFHALTAAAAPSFVAAAQVAQASSLGTAASPVVFPADNNDDDSQPQTTQEWSMTAQLKRMGFSDPREILTGVRAVLKKNPSAKVDDVMLWIVQQREEAEDARQVDAARARSEELRAEQAQRRQEEAARRRMEASFEDLATAPDLFASSVVLQLAQKPLKRLLEKRPDSKPAMLAFLELEKKARRWYGGTVPWCYFREVGEEWNASAGRKKLIKDMERRSQGLERAMYSLEEQQGGVPKLFREAQARAVERGLPTGPNASDDGDDDDDDDEVVLVREVSSDVASREENKSDSDCHVIEIA